MDLNAIVTNLLTENKKNKDETYKAAYLDGVMDLFNEYQKEVSQCQK